MNNPNIGFTLCYKTPWSRILLEKLTVAQLVRKFSAFHRRRKFKTVFKIAHDWCLSSASWILPTSSHRI